jgi:hypothetical protein
MTVASPSTAPGGDVGFEGDDRRPASTGRLLPLPDRAADANHGRSMQRDEHGRNAARVLSESNLPVET